MTRFVEVRHEDKWLVLDTVKPDSPEVVCICMGYKGPLEAEYIRQALEAYHSHLYSKFDVPHT